MARGGDDWDDRMSDAELIAFAQKHPEIDALPEPERVELQKEICDRNQAEWSHADGTDRYDGRGKPTGPKR